MKLTKIIVSMLMVITLCSCSVDDSMSYPQVQLSGFETSEDFTFEGLDWSSSVSETYEHFNISTDRVINPFISDVGTFSYSTFTSVFVEELGVLCDVEFVFLVNSFTNDEQKAGLTGIVFHFTPDTLEAYEKLNADVMDYYSRVTETNKAYQESLVSTSNHIGLFYDTLEKVNVNDTEYNAVFSYSTEDYSMFTDKTDSEQVFVQTYKELWSSDYYCKLALQLMPTNFM